MRKIFLLLLRFFRPMKPLIRPLPEGPLDIIGDIHGEYDALVALLWQLGYNKDGLHPDNRTVVFVGDFVDRGHNSTAVLDLAERWINAGRAVAVLGNHEINLLRNDPKEGSGWFFDEKHQEDKEKFGEYHRPDQPERENIVKFLSSLPIALERHDLRIIHAAWRTDLIEQFGDRDIGKIEEHFNACETALHSHLQTSGLTDRKDQEKKDHKIALKLESTPPPFLDAHAEYDEAMQMGNPLKVLTSGVERKLPDPSKVFRAGGKWRFVERVAWWVEYEVMIPVVIGHYWRSFKNNANAEADDSDLFGSVDPLAWHGKHNNVFCIDFSVGKRWKERREGVTKNYRGKLAALRWPEKTLMFDDGVTLETITG
jgi:hypothetical protein